MLQEKGLSELIAVVMTIAFVIAIGALVVTFATDFTREEVSRLEREGGQTIDCSITSIEIWEETVTIDGSTLRLTVENTGQTDLEDIDVTYRNTSTGPFETAELNESLGSGKIATLEIEGFENQVDRVIAETGCPGVTFAVENVSGTFKAVTE